MSLIFPEGRDGFEVGIKLSRSESEVYSQVKYALRLGGKGFVKRELQGFVRWVFCYVPSVSVVRSFDFWDIVGEKLTEATRSGDRSVCDFLPLLILICDVVEDSGGKRESSDKNLGTPADPIPSAPVPCPPYPSDLPQGRTGEGLHGNVSEGSQPPNPPLSPLPPCRREPDHLVADLPTPFLPMPVYPIAPVVPPHVRIRRVLLRVVELESCEMAALGTVTVPCAMAVHLPAQVGFLLRTAGSENPKMAVQKLQTGSCNGASAVGLCRDSAHELDSMKRDISLGA